MKDDPDIFVIEDTEHHLQMLGQELQNRQVTGEILVTDKVVLLLDVRNPEEHRDIEAYLRGDETAIEGRKDLAAYFRTDGVAIREAVIDIAEREGLPKEWLNDALRQLFFTPSTHVKWLEYPGLCAYLAQPDYILAMKIATGCSHGTKDIRRLTEKLHILNAQSLYSIIIKYIPEQLLTPEMRSLVEQTFEEK